jgi:hypothetical protein
VETTRPAAVFLDFDRTVASTRAGAAPVVGKHRLDDALLSVLTTHPLAFVVTRNSHAAEIEAFLRAAGVPEMVAESAPRVHSAKALGCTKAEVILPLLDAAGGVQGC